MNQPSTATATKTTADAIRPFNVSFPDEALDDLQRRIAATRWPDRELVNDPSQGVQLATIQKLAQYWLTEYDWRNFEARLNTFPHFITNIDGVDIHFIHVRSKEANALPLIITHGWPGSIVENLKVIDPLTNPTDHGGSAADAFDVVVPSIPGYGFSGKPTVTGWDVPRIARTWRTLMNRLGYTQFVAQGGDWGTPITEQLAIQAPKEVLGIHTHMPFAMPDEIAKALNGGPMPTGLSAEEKHAYDQLDFFFKKGLAYALEMGNRPQTLYGIEDSPVGLAAWIMDHDWDNYRLIARVFDGKTEGLTRDDILDNITLYWLTKTGVSSARLYWENKIPFFVPVGVPTPAGVTAFPEELYQAPRSWVERSYPNLIYYNKVDKGGHFAAWEQPKTYTQEVRAAFRTLRKS